ncbi:hypothetical protein F4808DRAFT_459345 [Astrocystis sublimbata]|nr:hypothetical protein F4808DRAFT_459345 [Astrocystis sublimbata]
MQFNTIFLTAAGAVLASCYMVDPNLKDGMYFVPRLTNSSSLTAEDIYGEPIQLADAVFPTGYIKRGDPNKPIPSTEHTCYKAMERQDDHDGALAIFSGWCNNGTKIPRWEKQSGMLLARYASSVVWGCSWGAAQTCPQWEIENAYSQIAGFCGGPLQGGQICAHNWKKCYGHSTFFSRICDSWT